MFKNRSSLCIECPATFIFCFCVVLSFSCLNRYRVFCVRGFKSAIYVHVFAQTDFVKCIKDTLSAVQSVFTKQMH